MTTSTQTKTPSDATPELNATIELPDASAPVYTTILDTELGPILLTSDGAHLTGLYLEVSEAIDARLDRAFGVEATPEHDLEIFHRTEAQLGEYFAGNCYLTAAQIPRARLLGRRQVNRRRVTLATWHDAAENLLVKCSSRVAPPPPMVAPRPESREPGPWRVGCSRRILHGGSDEWPDLAEVAHDVPFALFAHTLFASVIAQASLLATGCLEATGFRGRGRAASPPDELHPGGQGPAAWIGEWERGRHNSSSWFSGRGYPQKGRRYPGMTVR